MFRSQSVCLCLSPILSIFLQSDVTEIRVVSRQLVSRTRSAVTFVVYISRVHDIFVIFFLCNLISPASNILIVPFSPIPTELKLVRSSTASEIIEFASARRTSYVKVVTGWPSVSCRCRQGGNSLPSTVTAASTLHSFRGALKTHLFTASFPPSQLHFWANVTCFWLCLATLQSSDFTSP